MNLPFVQTSRRTITLYSHKYNNTQVLVIRTKGCVHLPREAATHVSCPTRCSLNAVVAIRPEGQRQIKIKKNIQIKSVPKSIDAIDIPCTVSRPKSFNPSPPNARGGICSVFRLSGKETTPRPYKHRRMAVLVFDREKSSNRPFLSTSRCPTGLRYSKRCTLQRVYRTCVSL